MAKIEREHVDTYKELFVHRNDVHAKQQQNGSYLFVRSPVTHGLLIDHIRGTHTLGFYTLDKGNSVRWAVLDADQDDGLERLQQAWRELDGRQVPSYLELSRRGGHLWTFFESPLPASQARQLLRKALPNHRDIELFPKQDTLSNPKSVGSLVRGPLGIHRVSGQRYNFADPISLRPVSSTVRGTLEYLAEAQKVPPEKAEEVVVFQAPPPQRQEPVRPELPRGPRRLTRAERSLVAKVKERLGDPVAFISRYVDLDERGRGSCPFHPPDNRPSFAVDRRTGRWTDFHEFDEERKEYTSGDVLDFYTRKYGLSLQDALKELRWYD